MTNLKELSPNSLHSRNVLDNRCDLEANHNYLGKSKNRIVPKMDTAKMDAKQKLSAELADMCNQPLSIVEEKMGFATVSALISEEESRNGKRRIYLQFSRNTLDEKWGFIYDRHWFKLNIRVVNKLMELSPAWNNVNEYVREGDRLFMVNDKYDGEEIKNELAHSLYIKIGLERNWESEWERKNGLSPVKQAAQLESQNSESLVLPKRGGSPTNTENPLSTSFFSGARASMELLKDAFIGEDRSASQQRKDALQDAIHAGGSQDKRGPPISKETVDAIAAAVSAAVDEDLTPIATAALEEPSFNGGRNRSPEPSRRGMNVGALGNMDIDHTQANYMQGNDMQYNAAHPFGNHSDPFEDDGEEEEEIEKTEGYPTHHDPIDQYKESHLTGNLSGNKQPMTVSDIICREDAKAVSPSNSSPEGADMTAVAVLGIGGGLQQPAEAFSNPAVSTPGLNNRPLPHPFETEEILKEGSALEASGTEASNDSDHRWDMLNRPLKDTADAILGSADPLVDSERDVMNQQETALSNAKPEYEGSSVPNESSGSGPLSGKNSGTNLAPREAHSAETSSAQSAGSATSPARRKLEMTSPTPSMEKAEKMPAANSSTKVPTMAPCDAVGSTSNIDANFPLLTNDGGSGVDERTFHSTTQDESGPIEKQVINLTPTAKQEKSLFKRFYAGMLDGVFGSEDQLLMQMDDSPTLKRSMNKKPDIPSTNKSNSLPEGYVHDSATQAPLKGYPQVQTPFHTDENPPGSSTSNASSRQGTPPPTDVQDRSKNISQNTGTTSTQEAEYNREDKITFELRAEEVLLSKQTSEGGDGNSRIVADIENGNTPNNVDTSSVENLIEETSLDRDNEKNEMSVEDIDLKGLSSSEPVSNASLSKENGYTSDCFMGDGVMLFTPVDPQAQPGSPQDQQASPKSDLEFPVVQDFSFNSDESDTAANQAKHDKRAKDASGDSPAKSPDKINGTQLIKPLEGDSHHVLPTTSSGRTSKENSVSPNALGTASGSTESHTASQVLQSTIAEQQPSAITGSQVPKSNADRPSSNAISITSSTAKKTLPPELRGGNKINIKRKPRTKFSDYQKKLKEEGDQAPVVQQYTEFVKPGENLGGLNMQLDKAKPDQGGGLGGTGGGGLFDDHVENPTTFATNMDGTEKLIGFKGLSNLFITEPKIEKLTKPIDPLEEKRRAAAQIAGMGEQRKTSPKNSASSSSMPMPRLSTPPGSKSIKQSREEAGSLLSGPLTGGLGDGLGGLGGLSLNDDNDNTNLAPGNANENRNEEGEMDDRSMVKFLESMNKISDILSNDTTKHDEFLPMVPYKSAEKFGLNLGDSGIKEKWSDDGFKNGFGFENSVVDIMQEPIPDQTENPFDDSYRPIGSTRIGRASVFDQPGRAFETNFDSINSFPSFNLDEGFNDDDTFKNELDDRLNSPGFLMSPTPQEDETIDENTEALDLNPDATLDAEVNANDIVDVDEVLNLDKNPDQEDDSGVDHCRYSELPLSSESEESLIDKAVAVGEKPKPNVSPEKVPSENDKQGPGPDPQDEDKKTESEKAKTPTTKTPTNEQTDDHSEKAQSRKAETPRSGSSKNPDEGIENNDNENKHERDQNDNNQNENPTSKSTPGVTPGNVTQGNVTEAGLKVSGARSEGSRERRNNELVGGRRTNSNNFNFYSEVEASMQKNVSTVIPSAVSATESYAGNAPFSARGSYGASYAGNAAPFGANAPFSARGPASSMYGASAGGILSPTAPVVMPRRPQDRTPEDEGSCGSEGRDEGYEDDSFGTNDYQIPDMAPITASYKAMARSSEDAFS